MDLEAAERWLTYVQALLLHSTIRTVRLKLHCFNIKFSESTNLYEQNFHPGALVVLQILQTFGRLESLSEQAASGAEHGSSVTVPLH
jgi:hypothetical protein